jgi:hypothetical protein
VLGWLFPGFLVAGCLRRRVGGVQLERPQAERLAAEPRTNELDADEWWRIIGGEEAAAGWGVEGRGLSPGVRVVVGEVSHAPIRIPPERAAMTVTSGDRAAQSGHRARLGRLMRKRELARV